ncbi:MAG: FAD-dependent oxidoreductase, partial [Gammaproteobacteria bacterium]
MSDTPSDTVQQAAIRWDDNGQPLSDAFDDVYFSKASGIEETRYVFLQHNGLPQRWQDSTPRLFTIGETGFGTGLNFLTAASAWLQQVKDANARLHFVSAEKYPLSKPDLQQALSLWPELSGLAAELIEQYPPPVAGIHRLYLADQRIVLTLLYGDAGDMFTSLKSSDHPLFHRSSNPRIDAWFLDGFAPAKNPSMWNDELFQAIADLSGPGTTFSTFTAAGIVRRGLQAVGFDVQKVQGFGHKRDMLCGQMAEPIIEATTAQDWQPASYNAKHQPPWYLAPQVNRPESVLVLGGGIAGCASARALAERGIPVTLIERHDKLA